MKKFQRHRKHKKTKQRENVLLICGGQVTEPNYLNDLIITERLQSESITVMSSKTSVPEVLLETAKTKYEESCISGVPYQRIYGIFDQDDYVNSRIVVKKFYKLSTEKVKFFPIISVPCFEYWFLLHFRYRCKIYKSIEGKSAAKFLLDELIQDWPTYKKTMKFTYRSLKSELDFAIENAKKSQSQANQEEDENYSQTNVNELVLQLCKLSQK